MPVVTPVLPPASQAACRTGQVAFEMAVEAIAQIRRDLIHGDAVAAMTAAAKVVAAKKIREEARGQVAARKQIEKVLREDVAVRMLPVESVRLFRDLLTNTHGHEAAYSRAAMLVLGLEPSEIAPIDYPVLMDLLGE